MSRSRSRTKKNGPGSSQKGGGFGNPAGIFKFWLLTFFEVFKNLIRINYVLYGSGGETFVSAVICHLWNLWHIVQVGSRRVLIIETCCLPRRNIISRWVENQSIYFRSELWIRFFLVGSGICWPDPALKEAVSRDFWPFFSLMQPFWVPDKQSEMVSLKNSLLRRY